VVGGRKVMPRVGPGAYVETLCRRFSCEIKSRDAWQGRAAYVGKNSKSCGESNA
jgi:hypothetical protein